MNPWKKFILDILIMGIPFGLLMTLFDHYDDKELSVLQTMYYILGYGILMAISFYYMGLSKKKREG